MRESARRDKPLPKFRPLPVSLKRRGVVAVDLARFYGNYETKVGRIKRFSFQFKMPDYLSGKMMHRMIRLVCEKIHYFNLVPLHEQGQTFKFSELMLRTPWIRVRKVRNYKAGVVYGK